MGGGNPPPSHHPPTPHYEGVKMSKIVYMKHFRNSEIAASGKALIEPPTQDKHQFSPFNKIVIFNKSGGDLRGYQDGDSQRGIPISGKSSIIDNLNFSFLVLENTSGATISANTIDITIIKESV